MKIILSRKGFDSGSGGYASLILPNGTLQSLPIPSNGDVMTYAEVKSRYQDKTLKELMLNVKEKIKESEWKELDDSTNCHLDPDIDFYALDRTEDWKGCFGQIGAAQTVLENADIDTDDLFLFFGWFNECEENDENSIKMKKGDGKHVLFGYLQIGEIIHTATDRIPEWLNYHPHAHGARVTNSSNTIYISRKTCSWDEKIPGYGVFKYGKELDLSKPGMSRSRWILPDFFKGLSITYHTEKSWKDDYFQSAARGQEFVVEEDINVTNWAQNIIARNICFNKELQIACINNDRLSCLERPLATVLNWLKIDYRFLFLSGWTFSYNYMESYQGIMDVPELADFLRNSEKYTGVHFEVEKLPEEMRDKRICYEILHDRPVIIYIDSYWCPWFPSYQKSHIHHYILVIGVNMDKGYFVCLDKLDSQKKVILPFEDYNRGSGEMLFMSVKKVMSYKNNEKELKKDCCEALNPETVQRNICEFASKVRYSMNVVEQIENYHDPKVTPLYTWLKGISNDRLNFSECLELFINNSYYKDNLKIIADKWRNIILLLIKAGTRKANEKTYESIAEKIEQIAETENVLMNELKEDLQNE